jgi:hypothetical protein
MLKKRKPNEGIYPSFAVKITSFILTGHTAKHISDKPYRTAHIPKEMNR